MSTSSDLIPRSTSNNTRDVALYYLERGWHPIPVKPSEKRPPVIKSWKKYQTEAPTPEEVTQWFTEHDDANIALVTGEASGIIAVDVDGAEGEESVPKIGATVPTLTNITPGGGRHLIFQHPGFHVSTTVRGIAPGIDIKGDGGYIIVYPSQHPNGAHYEWDDDHHMGLDLDPAPLPEGLRERLLDCERKAPGEKRSPLDLPKSIKEGQRNKTLARYAGRRLRDGVDLRDVLRECLDINDSRCEPPLDEKDVRTIVDSIARKEKQKRALPANPNRGRSERPPLVAVPLSHIQKKRVEWVWKGYIPLGKLTMLDGNPGVGKSTLSIDLAARVSTGRAMPDGTPGIDGSALILTNEDGLADTVQPRLEAMGGNPDRVRVVRTRPDEEGSIWIPPCIPDDIPALENLVKELRARLLIFDPLMGHLCKGIKDYSDHDVRVALSPLAQLAQDYGLAVLMIRHLNKKNDQSAIQRGGGSVGFIAVARMGFLLAEHPKQKGTNVLACVKSNIARKPRSREFVLEETKDEVPRIRWGGTSELTADDLLVTQKGRTKLETAVDFVEEVLARSKRDTEVVKEEARKLGISESTLKRARKKAGVIASKVGRPGEKGHWEMSLPPQDSPEEGSQDRAGPAATEGVNLNSFGGDASGGGGAWLNTPEGDQLTPLGPPLR